MAEEILAFIAQRDPHGTWKMGGIGYNFWACNGAPKKKDATCAGPPCWCALAERPKGDCENARREIETLKKVAP